MFLSDQAEDLQRLMHKMENWAHRLYPKLQFEEFIDKVEKLGKKKEVQVGRACSAEYLMKCTCFLKCSVCNISAFFYLADVSETDPTGHAADTRGLRG